MPVLSGPRPRKIGHSPSRPIRPREVSSGFVTRSGGGAQPPAAAACEQCGKAWICAHAPAPGALVCCNWFAEILVVTLEYSRGGCDRFAVRLPCRTCGDRSSRNGADALNMPPSCWACDVLQCRDLLPFIVPVGPTCIRTQIPLHYYVVLGLKCVRADVNVSSTLIAYDETCAQVPIDDGDGGGLARTSCGVHDGWCRYGAIRTCGAIPSGLAACRCRYVLVQVDC